MAARSARQRRAADSVSVSSTACRSKVERLMTFSMSAVTVCCCRDSRSSFEQAGVLDGDDGLGGEILHQRDLLVGKRPDFLPEDDDTADQYIVLEHRHAKCGTRAAELDYHVRDSLSVGVGVAHLLCPQQAAIRGIRPRPEGAAFAEEVTKCWQQAKRSHWVEYTVFMEEQCPLLRLANPNCVFQHRLEHRLQLARRACDDPQDLGSRRLLLQGFLFSAGTSRYLVPQCLIGGSKLRGAHFHPTIQFRMRSTQIFLDRFSHRDIGTEC